MGSMFSKPKTPKYQKPPAQPVAPAPEIMSKSITKEDNSNIGKEISDGERKRALLASNKKAQTGAGLGGNTSSGTGGKRKLLG